MIRYLSFHRELSPDFEFVRSTADIQYSDEELVVIFDKKGTIDQEALTENTLIISTGKGYLIKPPIDHLYWLMTVSDEMISELRNLVECFYAFTYLPFYQTKEKSACPLSTEQQLFETKRELQEAKKQIEQLKKIETKNKELIHNEIKLQKANETILRKKTLLESLNQRLVDSNKETENLNAKLEYNNKTLIRQNQILANTLDELKNTQSQLVQSEKMASVGMLMSGIAHEINNPLNFISGSINAISDYLSKEAIEHKNSLDKLLSAANTGVTRANKIVKSLNRFNRKSDRMDEICDMKLIVENCLVMIEDRTKDKVEVLTDFSEDSNVFYGNEGEIHQVMINLLVNAAQSISHQGRISILTERTSNSLTTSIIDNGSGIKESDLEKVTNPFFTTKDPGQGTGLGMSISYSIVKKHHGTIEYKSTVGEGTQVILTLPISKVVNN